MSEYCRFCGQPLEKKGNTITLALEEIAAWQLSSRDEITNGACWAEMPSFQRGLVWSPAQIEVLWDSLMRGIPIGALSLLPIEGSERFRRGGVATNLSDAYWLVDGQQRSNAIALGFSQFPSRNDPILWLDLLPDRSKRTRRKFFFYVTTPGRPWGYCVTNGNDERSCEKVPVDEYRPVVRDELKWDKGMGSKPPTYKLWPVRANLPLPFSLLRELGCEQNFEKIVEVVLADNAEWARHFQRRVDILSISKDFRTRIDEELSLIKGGLDRVHNTKTIGLITYGVLSGDEDENQEADENSNLAVYFSRLNRGGTPPKREDLDYSILKSIMPDLSVIDKYAEVKDTKNGDTKNETTKYLMHPSRLANIAMLTYLSLAKWKNVLNRSDIYKLQTDESFRRFILPTSGTEKSRFKEALDSVKTLLEYSSENEFGLPTVLYSSLIKDNQRLFRFLILFVIFQREKDFTIDRKMIITFVTIVSWFGRDADLEYEKLWERVQKITPSDDIVLILAGWIGNQIENDITKRNRTIKRIAIPPRIKDFEKIRDALSKKDIDLKDIGLLRNILNPIGYADGLNCLWNWTALAGRAFLLYVCRKYLATTFKDYDPASVVWNEDECPWDYDHIIPQCWLQTGKGKRKGDYNYIVRKFMMSIGNIAPIPFSINRSKQDAPPREYLEAANTEIFVDFCGIGASRPGFVDVPPNKRLEEKIEAARDFAYMTTMRWIALYNEWLRLPVFELLAMSVDGKRKASVLAIQQYFGSKGKTARIVYLWSDGKQYDVEDDWDWTRPRIACGVEASFKRLAKQNVECFLCVCTQKDQSQKDWFKVGLRRSPESNTPFDEHNEWWIVDQDDLFLKTDSLDNALGHLEKLRARPDVVLQ